MSVLLATTAGNGAAFARNAMRTVPILLNRNAQSWKSLRTFVADARTSSGVLYESMSISRILQTSPIGRRSPKAGRGLAIDPLELERIDKVVSPLIKNGQSIHHVFMSNADELMVSEKTAYNYLNAGLFDADKMDCPRIIRMRPRRSTPKLKIDRHCYEGRTYEDFMRFIADNPDVPVVQMDSVIGNKSGKVLLTMFSQNTNLLLAFLRDHNTARSVLDVFNDLYAMFGRKTYCRLFPVILTDRGSEFSNPVPIEQDENGELRSLVFYCNPSAPYQKGGVEVAHELVRRVLPKGKSFDDLQQEDIDLMLSHINSYKRGKLNSRSAHQLFSFIYGDDILPKLNIHEIEPNDIVLSPKLLKK